MARLVRIPDDVVFRGLTAGGGVLLHLESGRYHRVNDTGAEICRLLDGERDVDAVISAVQSRHPDVPPEQVAADVVEFVDTMRDRRLLVEAGLPA